MTSHLTQLDIDIASALLHDRQRRSSVSCAINAHLNAVRVDEAQFDDAGVAFNAAAAASVILWLNAFAVRTTAPRKRSRYSFGRWFCHRARMRVTPATRSCDDPLDQISLGFVCS